MPFTHSLVSALSGGGFAPGGPVEMLIVPHHDVLQEGW